MNRLAPLGLSRDVEHRFVSRMSYSQSRLETLAANLRSARHTRHFKKLTVYTAGSYGRLEASKYSDIDLFFVLDQPRNTLDEFHVPEIRLLSEMIEIGIENGFPKFSNDGQFLKILFANEILDQLGSPADDYLNHFTARMLLLLESKPIFGSTLYKRILSETIESYFRDYPHHPANFRPTFLINDILRFWKTLCLNYEHKRNQAVARHTIKTKVKNFKLGFSRLLTCFGTVALLSTFRDTVSPKQVLTICQMTPMERLISVSKIDPELGPRLKEALDLYGWFLSKTALSTPQLEKYFSNKGNRIEAFAKSRLFGDKIFDILRCLDKDNQVMRYLVV
jgi:predicted nucleotidyltransferase